MKPAPSCVPENRALEEAAAAAEQRKLQALDRLNEKLGVVPERDAFENAMRALIEADRAALQARGR